MTRCLTPNVAAIYVDERVRRRLITDGRLLPRRELLVIYGRTER